MCPDTLPEWEFIEIWERVVDRIDVRRITVKGLRNKLTQQYVYSKQKGRVKDGRANTLVDKKFPEKWFKHANDYPDSVIARDLWGFRRIETWKDNKKRMVWRDKKGHFSRKPEIIARAKPRRRIERGKPRR